MLVGLLVYFLRAPDSRISGRARHRRSANDLVTAAAMKEDAARQIAEIDAKVKQLPGELDALRARGQQEIAAEETRIEQAAASERDRLLEQTRREIDLQLRAARRELVVARRRPRRAGRARTHPVTDDHRGPAAAGRPVLEQVTTHGRSRAGVREARVLLEVATRESDPDRVGR